MKLAFYKGKYGNIFDYGIMLWTLGEYSHVELVFSDGLSFSSSQWDGGVRFKQINYSHPERWTFIDIPTNKYEESLIRERSEKEVGRKYDWVGIFLHQFLPLNIQDDNKWWCSEIVAHVLTIKPEKVSPNKLYKIICNSWG